MSTTTNADDEYPQVQSYISTPVTIVLTVFLIVFIFVGFFSLFFCRCFLKNLMRAWNLQQTPSGNLARAGATEEDPLDNPGLDPKIIQLFPSFPFSSVKDQRLEKQGMECAICLSEFSGDDTLRLITACYHVFHRECIDLWFESHKTCPVCRCELDPVEASPEKSPGITGIDQGRTGSHESLHDAVTIAVREDIPDNPSSNTDQMGESHGQREDLDRRLSRSHSTGHSTVRPKTEEQEDEEDEDKYRLRLPEHVNVTIARGHNQTESCITFGELTRSDRAGERGWLGEASIGSSRVVSKA